MQSRFYCPSFAYCRFPSGDAGRGRRPFRSLPQAGACTPLGNNLSPVCGQCRRRFRFTAAVPLPPGMSEGVTPSAFFRRQGRVPRRGNNLSPVCGQCRRRFRFIAAVPLPPGCRKGPPPLPLSSAGGGVYPARKQFAPRLRSMPSAFPIYRRRPSSSGMPEEATAPSPFFRRRGRVPRRGAIFCLSGRNDLLSSSLPSVPKTSAEGKSLPIHKTRCTA